MNTQDERQAPTPGLTFFAKSQLLSADDVSRALKRMAHEIIERNERLDDVYLVGLQRLTQLLREISGSEVPLGLLDVSFFRDDLEGKPFTRSSATTIEGDLTGRTIVLVDDVLFTGRTIRAALNALSDWGRPRAVQLAVMVDRGHRELPIRPDFVGKNLPTAANEAINALLEGVWIGEKREQ
jgi:pyrimidine operon attenuation protein / uracil phosphoribosyltransferase